jgi:hypothetical protein
MKQKIRQIIFTNAFRPIRDDICHHMLTALVKTSDSFTANCTDICDMVADFLRATKFQSSLIAYIH